MATQQSWLRKRLPDLSTAISRFPLAAGLAALLTLYKLYRGNDIGDAELRIIFWLIASFLWAVAVDFYAESRGRAFHARALLWAIGIALLALLFWLDLDIWLNPRLVIAGLGLLVGLSGHLGRRETNASFWLFNQRLVLAALLGLAAAVLLGAGLSAIHETLKYLFGLDFGAEIYDYIWTVSLSFVAPMSFLAFAPRSFTDSLTAREESDFTFRAASILVKFVMVPLLLVYTAILYAYAVKIALAWQLPKGTLALMVTAYLLVGTVTLLVGYPSRESGGPLMRLFWRYWVWLAALPVLLLFIAVWRRIADYGMTEQRYLIVLIGIWTLILGAARVWRGPNFDLRLVPGVLALMLLAASFGPGGAIGFSVMSQRAELASILAEKGLLVDGKIVKPASADADPLGDDAARVRGIEWYLNTHHALAVLSSWFEGLPDNPFAEGKTPDQTASGVLAALGITGELSNPEQTVYLNHYSEKPVVLDVPQGAHLIGPMGSSGALNIEPETIEVAGVGNIEFAFDRDSNLLTVSLGSRKAEFAIADAIKELKRRGWPGDTEYKPVELKGSGDLDATLLLEAMTGNYTEREFTLLTIRFWILLR